MPSTLNLQKICLPSPDRVYADTNDRPRIAGDSPATIADAASSADLRQENLPKRLDDLIGESGSMRRLYGQICQIAETESTVLVLGETGTGKELVARALHRRSLRGDQPLVAVNCAAFSENLLESELFGHVRGAFTDARTDRKGVFVLANDGSLLLDEIGEMPLKMQAKLLRTLEQGTVRPVGSEHEIEVNVRLIAATHCDLEKAVKERRFREDLFYRINVIPLELPPLRERAADVPVLARHFLRQLDAQINKGILDLTPAAEDLLRRYNWPGNVRELRNVIERGVTMSSQQSFGLAEIPEKIRTACGPVDFLLSEDPTSLIPLKEVERRYILHVLRTTGGNKSVAARILGIARETLSRMVRTLGVDH